MRYSFSIDKATISPSFGSSHMLSETKVEFFDLGLSY